MRLGLIARGDNRGLGQQTWMYHRNLAPAKTMVVDCPSAKPLPLRMERFPDAQIVKGIPTRNDLARFLDGVDVVLTAECAYNDNLYTMAERRGVKTVLALNYEFMTGREHPSLWAAPSLWHYDDIPSPKVHLPVPVELDRFRYTQGRGGSRSDAGKLGAAGSPFAPAPTCEGGVSQTRAGCSRPHLGTGAPPPHFLHLIGRPAVVKGVERQGTVDLLKALQYVREDITVTIRCQEPGYVNSLIGQHRIRTPKNVVLRVDSGDVENYWDCYTEGDVMVLPRRWGGLSLPTNEAIAAGMPCLMPDISPNNTWLPDSWLFPAVKAGEFQAKQAVTFYRTDPVVLAAKLDEYARLQPSSWVGDVQRLQHELSWQTLKPRYEEVLNAV